MSVTFNRLLPFLDDSFGFSGGFSGTVEVVEVYDPVWLRCQDAVTEALQALATAGELEGISADSVIACELPDVKRYFGEGATDVDDPLDFPGIMVWPYQQEVSEIAAGDNLRDEIVYPIAVSVIDKGSHKTGVNSMAVSRSARRLHMLWREVISNKFRHFDVGVDLPEIRDVYVRPGVYAIDAAYRANNIYHGVYVIDFYSLETRASG